MGAIVLTLAIAIFAASLFVNGFHRKFAHYCGLFGSFVGSAIAYVILTPLFVVGFSLVRAFMWCSGQDPLCLRKRNARTYWLPSDNDQRKRRFTRSMFATDPVIPRVGASLVPLACLGLLMLAGGEGLLRFLGYGNAVLYTADARAGYFPAPNQVVERFGGRVETNSMGMRAPEFASQKEGGTFRILLLGDSTLYGGQYIDQSELYARLLQESLVSDEQRNVEVLNMGVNGWGPFNKLGYVESYGTHDADLCVICMPFDDLRRPLVSFWQTPYFRAEAPPRLAYEEVLHHLNWRQRTRAARRKDPPTEEDRKQTCLEAMDCYLVLAETIQKTGCDVIFEILPSRTAATTNKVPATEADFVGMFAQKLKSKNLPYAFPTAMFVDRSETVEQLYHDVIHLNPVGHQLYAEYLAGQIRSTPAWSSFSASTVSETEGAVRK